MGSFAGGQRFGWGTLLVGLGTALVFSGPSCQAPTQMTLELTTDVACKDLTGVSLVVGRDPAEASQKLLRDSESVPVNIRCEGSNLGTLVFHPDTDSNQVSLIVRAGMRGKDPRQCLPSNAFQGCIVARRIFSYLPHTRLRLPVHLATSCLDRPCDERSTCDDGKCRSSNAQCTNERCDVGLNPVIAPAPTPTPTPTPIPTPTSTTPVTPTTKLGTATLLGTCTETGTAISTSPVCWKVEISGCDSLPALEAAVLVSEPIVSLQGTVLLTAGEYGAESTSFYDGAAFGGVVVKTLWDNGYRVVQHAWRGPGNVGWMPGTQGVGTNACRYATLATWIHKEFYLPEAKGKFCGSAQSSGTLELGYALTRYGRESIFDYALFTSGPTGRLDDHCSLPRAAWANQCAKLLGDGAACKTAPCGFDAANKAFIDSAFNASVCSVGTGPQDQAKLLAESILAPSAQTSFSKTQVEIYLGANDCTTSTHAGALAFADAIRTQGTVPSVVFVPSLGHNLLTDNAAAMTIAQRLRSACK